jgi:hypothetical protein
VSGDATRPGIASQWIKANVIGGAINVAVTFVAFLVGQVLDVNEPDASAVLQAGYVMLATAALAFGVVALGYLSGVVLRTKLPAFPMHRWLTLYIALGVAFGLVSALAWLTPDTAEDIGPVKTDIAVTAAVGAALAGAAIAAAVGSVQALILRPAAQGLGLWIACSAFAGTLFVLVVLAILYGPQSGFAQELVIELATLAVTVLERFTAFLNLGIPLVGRIVIQDAGWVGGQHR